MNIVYLNGSYLPIEQAKVSVLDRGFLFGDGIYEVITIYNGKLFQAKDHLDRLEKNLQAIRLNCPLNQKQWLDIFTELMLKNNIGTQNKSLYLQVTRGAEKKRSLGLPESVIEPTIFVMLKELISPNYNDTKEFSAITHEDIRGKYCHIKSIALLPNILMQQQAKEVGAEDVIYLRDNKITEGSNSNVFIVKNNVIITTPICEYVLDGVTRKLIIYLANQHKIPLEEKIFSKEDLLNADEVWISSSSRDIMPITLVDNQTIGSGKRGNLWKKMIEIFQQYKQTL